MKKCLYCTIAAVAYFIVTGESDAAEPGKTLLEINFSTKVLTQYAGDTGVVAYNRPVSQNDLTITLIQSGMYLDIWQSVSLSHPGRSTNYGNEIEYYAGWSGEISGIGVDTGVGYFDLITLFSMPEGDVIQPYFELNKKFDAAKRTHTHPVCQG